MSLEPGQIVEGKYRITRLLGEGGMGAVYECENTAIQKRFAIKVLHAAVAGNKDAVGRFEKEAQAAGRIGSDHITEVVDLGTLPSGDRFMVMEFLDGSTLSDRIKERSRLSPAEAAPILVQLLEGLQAAHQAGIIHRDLKPDNVFLLRNKAGIRDFVKILDFGISKFNRAGGGDTAMSMTRTGAVMGTPYYMSPEQAKGSKEIDARSDLYSVGVILFEAITGQVPFNADTFNELIFKIVLEAPPPPEQIVPDLDPAFGALIRRAMARDPSQRFQTASEFQQTVMQWMQGGGVRLFEESSTSATARIALAAHDPGRSPSLVEIAQPTPTAPPPVVPASSPVKPLLIGASVLALAALVGVGALALRSTPAPTPPEVMPSATASATQAATTAAPPPASTAPVASAPPSASAPEPAESAAPSATVAGKNTPPPATTKAGSPPPTTPPATPTKPPPAAGTAGGRKIRTGLD